MTEKAKGYLEFPSVPNDNLSIPEILSKLKKVKADLPDNVCGKPLLKVFKKAISTHGLHTSTILYYDSDGYFICEVYVGYFFVCYSVTDKGRAKTKEQALIKAAEKFQNIDVAEILVFDTELNMKSIQDKEIESISSPSLCKESNHGYISKVRGKFVPKKLSELTILKKSVETFPVGALEQSPFEILRQSCDYSDMLLEIYYFNLVKETK